MIHGHHFHFADMPEIQKEYDSFGFSAEENALTETIRVEEIDEAYAGFEQRKGLVLLSGREAYYLYTVPFSDLGKEDDWGLEIVNVLTLVWDAKKRRILYAKGEKFTARLLQFWIFHTFFPIVLELEREYKMLHVGAVEAEGGPILFAGPSFAGKSTMTDFFLKQGHTLFSDDTLPVREENGVYVVYPSFPYHRPYREPETLGYRMDNFARKPAPIKALFDLHGVAADAPVEISIPKGLAKFKAFFYSGFIKFPFMKKERMAYFAQMAKEVPVYKVSVPWDKERLPEVYAAIIEKTKTL